MRLDAKPHAIGGRIGRTEQHITDDELINSGISDSPGAHAAGGGNRRVPVLNGFDFVLHLFFLRLLLRLLSLRLDRLLGLLLRLLWLRLLLRRFRLLRLLRLPGFLEGRIPKIGFRSLRNSKYETRWSDARFVHAARRFGFAWRGGLCRTRLLIRSITNRLRAGGRGALVGARCCSHWHHGRVLLPRSQ